MEFKEALLKYEFDKNRVKNFLSLHNLSFEEDIEYTILLEEEDKIIGTGSVSGNVLKCIAVDNKYQGYGISNKIVTKLIAYQNERGINHLFIFTKPEHTKKMLELGFSEVINIENKIVLLDNKISEIKKFVDEIYLKIKNKFLGKNIKKMKISSIVMNANPFTYGHKYLVDQACLNEDLVIVFVVRENKSRFPFDVRYECVKQGLKDNEKVIVCDAGEYIISNSTFPTYFLKEKKIINDLYSKMDATIFFKYIANPLNISSRYLGEEPLDITTQNYNQNLKEILEKENIKVNIIPRKKVAGEIISASYFRKYLDDGNIEAMKDLAPETTIKILRENFFIK